MISGTAIGLLLLIAQTASTPIVTDSLDTAALITSLRREAPATTAYREIRFVDMLDAPLQLRGELEYRAGGNLSKQVNEPYRELTTIADGNVTIERTGKRTKRFALKRAPELGGFLQSFIAVLSGDAQALQQTFAVEVSGVKSQWRLQLTPKDAGLARKIRSIEIDGVGQVPQCFQIQQGDGDLSLLLVDTLAAAALPDPLTREALIGRCRTP